MTDLPPLLKAALQLRAETDISRLFLPAMDAPNHLPFTDHPITPPPELFKQWEHLPRSLAFEAAYRAGADQELEACCKLLDGAGIFPPDGAKTYPENLSAARERMGKLRAARRPKSPSLKEQALKAQQRMWNGTSNHDDWNLVRRALEQLDD